jgi:hypothetical protein
MNPLTGLILVPTIIIIALVLAILLDQTIPSLKNWTPYIIKRGDHYTQTNFLARLLPYTKNTLTFSVIFGRGSDYSIVGDNKFDINKLYGIGTSLKGPKHNSVRVGWRWSEFDQHIQLFLYVRDKGRIFTEYMGGVRLGEQVTFTLSFKDRAELTWDKNNYRKASIPLSDKPLLPIYYRLFPYFGGDQKAPNDIKILIKEL